MNQNTKDLIKFSLCTGSADKEDIIKILRRSPIFEIIERGNNDCYNYEGYIANLFEIISDIKEQDDYPKEIDKITVDVVAAVTRTEIDAVKQRHKFAKHIAKEAQKIAVL